MHVMIAVDGSEASDAALAAAAELFGTDVDYTIVSVGPPLPVSSIEPFGLAPALLTITSPDGVPILDSYSNAEDAVEEARAALEAGHVRSVDTVVEVGGPAPTICKVAAEHDIDVIVVGAHERGWLSRLVRPSIAHDLIDDAPCHVLVVRHQD
jgi:nucleotide-binding universal stress UspA family protein